MLAAYQEELGPFRRVIGGLKRVGKTRREIPEIALLYGGDVIASVLVHGRNLRRPLDYVCPLLYFGQNPDAF